MKVGSAWKYHHIFRSCGMALHNLGAGCSSGLQKQAQRENRLHLEKRISIFLEFAA
jgi:hypothetical protein